MESQRCCSRLVINGRVRVGAQYVAVVGKVGSATRRENQFGVERLWARVKTCRGSVRTELRQAYPQRAYPRERRRGNMRKLALSGVALGLAMAVGAAQAQPLTLSEDQMDGVTAAGPALADGLFNWNINTNVHETTDIFKLKQVLQLVDLDGYFADAKSAANAFGDGAEALTATQTEADAFQHYATSLSLSESAADEPKRYYHKSYDSY
jgi:hypothetical protein